VKSLGDFDLSTVVYGKFTTYQPSTGAAFALGGSAALSVYKDNSLTQSTTGVTLTVSFDSVTGLNHFAIDTSADGTFYSAGSFFDIVLTTGTVDGVSVVGAVVASFSIRKNSALKPATAGRTLVVDAAGLADANAVKLGPTGAGTAQTARDIGTSVLVGDKTGFSLSGAGVQAIWDALTSALTTAGSIGKWIVDKLDVVLSTRLASSGYTTPPTVGAIADQVWDETMSDHLTAGSTGASLNAAGSAGDPWTTSLPGAYGAGTAGKIVGDNLNATVSSRLATSGYTAPDNADIVAIKAKTDGLTFTVANQVDVNVVDWKGSAAPAMTGDAFARLGAPAGASVSADIAAVKVDTAAVPTANANADALLDRANGIETGKTLRQSIRLILSSAVAKLSGAGTTNVIFRDINDTKNRIDATVDASGNRSSVTTDAT
jgi:hypothetical protein